MSCTISVYRKIPGSARKLCLMAAMLLLWTCPRAQNPKYEGGFPFVKYYGSKDYKAHTQNFAVLQDDRRMMYFGNFAGILEFDGSTFRLIPTKEQTKVSSLAVGKDGKVFVGARGEAGYLEPDSAGRLRFVTLMDKLNPGDRKFFDVTGCFSGSDGTWFVAGNSILFWNDKAFTVTRTGNQILSSFLVNGTLYFQEKGTGLMSMASDRPALVRGGEQFVSAVEVKSMTGLKDGKILLATDNQGLFMMDPQGITRFRTTADNYLYENKVTCGAMLGDQSLIVGTLRKGLAVFSLDGTLLLLIDKDAGLVNESVSALLIDKDKAVWAALNDGLARIEFPAPLTYFAENNGLEGGVTALARFKGILYAATYKGLFHLDDKSHRFVAVPGILTACWSLLETGDQLLVASSQGIHAVRDLKVRQVADGFTLSLLKSVVFQGIVYAGQLDGIMQFRESGGNLAAQGKIAGISEEVREMAEDADGMLWLSGTSGNIYSYDPRSGKASEYGTVNGLATAAGNHVIRACGKTLFATPKGLLEFDHASDSFKPCNWSVGDSTLSKYWISRMTDGRDGEAWITSGAGNGLTCLKKTGDNKFNEERTPFLPVSDFIVWSILADNGGILWAGGPEGVIRYDASVHKNYKPGYSVFIRKITINNDSLIFGGTAPTAGVSGTPADIVTVLRPGENTIRFEFSAPVFDIKGTTVYQYYLEGFDKVWSDWTPGLQKEYTNIPSGSYAFHVRASDVYGNQGKEAVFRFRIQTPWYNTWFAYILYAVLLGAIIYVLVLLRSRQLLKEKKALENLIRERTAEVVQQKEEIEQTSQELAYKNEELEKINNVVKSINAQIHFANLLQSILEKLKVIRGVEKAAAIVLDKESVSYSIKASVGRDTSQFEGLQFKLPDLEEAYLKGSEEIFEDIFLKTNEIMHAQGKDPLESAQPKSRLVMVIRLENTVEGFIVLDNMVKENAFDQKDLSFVRNLKQHIISAFIKTRILEDLEKTLEELKSAQDQLVQSEKLASLGQLTAGIAHEIQNPLNFVNNFSALSADLAVELKEHIEKIKDKIDEDTRYDMEDVIGMIESNVKKITEHGKRAESIVKGMLQHSRGRSGEFELTDINNMVNEYVNLAYHGMRAKDKSFNTALRSNLDPAVPKIKIVPQDLSRVILNIVNNSCYAVDEKNKKGIPGYAPEIAVTTKKQGPYVVISIRDNGTGIPQKVLDKIFNPFFTTKPTGQGTGLGLSMSFDIVTQIHKGKLEVKTEEGEYTEFIISIPENIQK